MLPWLLAAGLLVAIPDVAADRKPNLIIFLSEDVGSGLNGYVSDPYYARTQRGLMTGRE